MNYYIRYIVVIIGICLMSCAHQPKNSVDPLEPYNRAMFHVNDTIDHTLLIPVAKTYRYTVPPLARTGISNVFQNISNLPSAANYTLQGNFDRAIASLHRFAFSIVFGLGGLIDLTKPFNLPAVPANDFGITLAHYGWTDSYYFVMPLFGPSTLRDTTGTVADAFWSPTRQINDVGVRNSLFALNITSHRESLLEASEQMQNASLDPYVFQRELFLQYRQKQLQKQGAIQINTETEEDDISNFARQRRNQ